MQLCKLAGESTSSIGPGFDAGVGEEVSTFLRCYHYKTGDASAPHYDRYVLWKGVLLDILFRTF